MKKLLILAAAALMLVGCGKKFTVSGTVAEADGQTLYLEHCGLVNTEVVDSAVLKAGGSFSFKAERPEYPDLYRLRLSGKNLMLAVDSLDKIQVTANASNIADAAIQGSEKSVQIQQLRKSLREKSLDEHKTFAKGIILENPASMVAYYALFQQKSGNPVFDVYNKEDRSYFQAVATSFHAWMPSYKRSEVIYNQVLDVINGERRQLNNDLMKAFIDEQENTFLDVTFKDENGNDQALSQYKGKVIVLDFTSTQMDRYTGYQFEMKEIYNAYNAKGVEIYEVYPDQNKLVWEDLVRALPWTTVRTENGTLDPVFATYNVQQLPTIFVYSRTGEIVGRYADFKSLRSALDNLVK